MAICGLDSSDRFVRTAMGVGSFLRGFFVAVFVVCIIVVAVLVFVVLIIALTAKGRVGM
jgi:hypothetical protein